MKKKLKLQCRDGYTLVEMMVVMACLTIFMGIIVIGMKLSVDNFRRTYSYSDAQTFSTTVTSMISEELRYATNVSVDKDYRLYSYSSINQTEENCRLVIYTREEDETDNSIKYRGLAVQADGALIPLLGPTSYMDGCSIELSTKEGSTETIPFIQATYDEAKKQYTFRVTFDLIQKNGTKSSLLKTVQFDVRCLTPQKLNKVTKEATEQVS